MRRREILAVLALVALLPVWWHVTSTEFRRELPWSAREVDEWHWSDGFLPDYSHHLRAKIPAGEFEAYVARLGLEPIAETEDLHSFR